MRPHKTKKSKREPRDSKSITKVENTKDIQNIENSKLPQKTFCPTIIFFDLQQKACHSLDMNFLIKINGIVDFRTKTKRHVCAYP